MRIAFIAVWLVVLFSLALSSYEVKAHLHSMGRYHLLYHLLAFSITTILIAWKARTIAARALSSLLVVAIAFATEWLEYLRFHNSFEWVDIGSDCEGILIGLVILTVLGAILPAKPSAIQP